MEIKEIGINQPRIPDIAVLPIRNNIPSVERLTFNFPKPIIDLPCVEAREDYSTQEVFNFDKGSYSSFCDFKFGSFNPPILTPSVVNKLSDEVMGSVMKKSFLSYKNDEWERYHQAVTDWEVKEYLRLY